jgi:acyl carrier protein/N-acetylglutamate synthase-like GNAT family acetyltransferase
MKMVATRFDPFHLPRIAQLIQRSNQFNLTTRRYSEADCESLMKDPGVLPLYATLSDRLGDHGLIGVIVVAPEHNALLIRDWLMSCRVLARGVEQTLMNLVVKEARERKLSKVRGEYIRTAKNQMVEDFFARFGFTQIGSDKDHTHWELDTNAYEAKEGPDQLNDTKERIQEAFRDIFDDNLIVLRDDMTAADVENWDSLNHIDMIVAIESEFKIKFTTAEVTSLKNVGELIALVNKKRAAKS